ncbi:MAG: hypothetical protein QXL16_01585 [Candidatus Micrarchaeaceae archaeon]
MEFHKKYLNQKVLKAVWWVGMRLYKDFLKGRLSGEDGLGDLRYAVENTCMRCGRLFEKSEVKIVPSRYFQESDIYVKNGFVKRRYICAKCYESFRIKLKEPLIAKRDLAIPIRY